MTPSSLNLPRPSTWHDGEHRWVSLAWGTAGGDPVWEISVRLPTRRRP